MYVLDAIFMARTPTQDYRNFAIYTSEQNEDTNIVILWLLFHGSMFSDHVNNANDLLQLQKKRFSDANKT